MIKNKGAKLSVITMAAIIGLSYGTNQTKLVEAKNVLTNEVIEKECDDLFSLGNVIKFNSHVLKNVQIKEETEDDKNVLEEAKDVKGAFIYTTKYTKTNLNIRKKPNKTSKVVNVFSQGDKVNFIKEINNKWSQIFYNDKTYYVYTKYLTDKKPVVLNSVKEVAKKIRNFNDPNQQKNAETIAKICIENWEKYGCLPSVAIAQAFIESTLGKYCPSGSNNLWGICSGAVKYNSIEDGVYGYMRVINNGYYKGAPHCKDYSTQISRILAGGYCIPAEGYYSNIIWTIKHYQLYEYDKLVK